MPECWRKYSRSMKSSDVGSEKLPMTSRCATVMLADQHEKGDRVTALPLRSGLCFSEVFRNASRSLNTLCSLRAKCALPRYAVKVPKNRKQHCNALRCANAKRSLKKASNKPSDPKRQQRRSMTTFYMNPTNRQSKQLFHTLLVFRCPTSLSERLAAVAHKRRTNVSALIRELLEHGLASNPAGESA